MSPTTRQEQGEQAAQRWNTAHPIGTQVIAYPVTRDDAPLYTWTRSRAWTLGHGDPVVTVEGYTGGICLTHIDTVDGWVLTSRNYLAIEAAIDRDGTFTKQYTRSVDGRIATVGMRIGEKPGHVVAFFGDTIVRRRSGIYTVRRP
ncbi:hypothetical protein [Streptomyces xiamenensis]|uniref:hypothetical protein n=1 Tax=Streptomyces xiamenensis TaxID=408015 RepID=UPI0037D2AC74